MMDENLIVLAVRRDSQEGGRRDIHGVFRYGRYAQSLERVMVFPVASYRQAATTTPDDYAVCGVRPCTCLYSLTMSL